MYQLIYTSAPRLLEAGKTGFGTLARSKEMPQPLVSYIERLSTFDRAAGINSLCFYSLFRQGALQYHVFSHVAEAGADYTGRTNHLAEHYAVEAGSEEERCLMDGTPAGMMLALAPLWHRSYNEGPSYLGEPALPSAGATSDTGSWKQAAGGGDCARWLAQPNYKDGACLRFDEVVDEGRSLKLLHDAFLHMSNHGWGVGFSTATVSNLSSKVVPFTVLDARQAAAGVTCPRGCPELKITHGMQAPPKEAAPAGAQQPLPRHCEPKMPHVGIPSLPTVPPPGSTPPPPSVPPAFHAASTPPPPVNDEELSYFGGGARPPKPREEQKGNGIPMPAVVGGSVLIGGLLAFALLKNDTPEEAPAPKPNTEQKPVLETKNDQIDHPVEQPPNRNTGGPQQALPQNPTTEVDISAQRNEVETAKKEFEKCKVEFDKLGDRLPEDCMNKMQRAHDMLIAAEEHIKDAQAAGAANAAAKQAKDGASKAKESLDEAREYISKTAKHADADKTNSGKGENPAEGDNDFCSADNKGEPQAQDGEPAKAQPAPKPVRRREAAFAMGSTSESPQSDGQYTSTNPEVTIPEGSTCRISVGKDSVEVLPSKDKGSNGTLELDIKVKVLRDQLPKDWQEQFRIKDGGHIMVSQKSGESIEITDRSPYCHTARITYNDKQLQELCENQTSLSSGLPEEIKHLNDSEGLKAAKKGKGEVADPEAVKRISAMEERVGKLLGKLKESPHKELRESLKPLKQKLHKLADAPNGSWQNTLNVANNILNRLDACLQKPTPKQRIKEIEKNKLFMGDFCIEFTVKRVETSNLYLEIKHTYTPPKQP